MIKHTNQILFQQIYDDLCHYTDKDELSADRGSVVFISRGFDEAKQDHITSYFAHGSDVPTRDMLLRVMEKSDTVRDYILMAALRYLGDNYSNENILELVRIAKKP